MTNEKNKYLTTFESLNTPVILTTISGEIENVNYKTMEYFENFISPGSQYYNKTDIGIKLSWLREDIDKFLQTNKNEFIYEREINTKKGIRFFEIKLKKMLDISDKFNGITIIFNDITEFMEFDNLRKKFVSTVSHELRTPITSIDLSIKLLENHYNSLNEDKRNRLIQNISSSTSVLTHLIENLLILSRIDSKKDILDIHEIKLDLIIQKIIFELEPNAACNNIKILYQNTEEISIEGDEFRIAQIVRIILDNAIKYSHPDSKIIVKVKKYPISNEIPDKYSPVLVKVQDNGIGIKPGDVKNLFQRFFRSEEVANIKGTGLGLSIAKDLVELHHGTINIESEFGKGTTVNVILPQKFKKSEV
jgi:two-component system phosphate regulon sensor histidine kinase PhoR